MTIRQILLLLAVLAAVLVGCGRSKQQLISSGSDTSASAAFREKAQQRWAALLADPRSENVASDEQSGSPTAVASSDPDDGRFRPVAGLRKLIGVAEESYPPDPFLQDPGDDDLTSRAEPVSHEVSEFFTQTEDTGTPGTLPSARDRSDDGTRMVEERQTTRANDSAFGSDTNRSASPANAGNEFDRFIADSNDRLDSLEQRLAASTSQSRDGVLDEITDRQDVFSGWDDVENNAGYPSSTAPAVRAGRDSVADEIAQILMEPGTDSDDVASFEELLADNESADGRGNSNEAKMNTASRSAARPDGEQNRNPFRLASDSTAFPSDSEAEVLIRQATDFSEFSVPEDSKTLDNDSPFDEFLALDETSPEPRFDSDASESANDIAAFESFLAADENDGQRSNDDLNAAADPFAPFGDDTQPLRDITDPFKAAFSDTESTNSSLVSIPAVNDSEPIDIDWPADESTALAMVQPDRVPVSVPNAFPTEFQESGAFQTLSGSVEPNTSSVAVRQNPPFSFHLDEQPVTPGQPPAWDIVAEARRVTPRSWFLIVGSILVVALLLVPRNRRRLDR